MNRNEKIALLKGIAEGRVTLEHFRQAVPFNPVVIYVPMQDRYRLSGENEFMSQHKLKQRIKGAQKVFYIPDNNRDRRLSI